MRIYQLFHELIAKFVPMDQLTQSDLQLEAVNYYNKALDEIKEIEKANILAAQYNEAHKEDLEIEPKPMQVLNVKQRVIKALDAWYVRYLIAIAFIYLVPMIKAYISGEKRGKGDEDEDEDEHDEAEMFKQYMNFKRSMR